MLGRAGDVRGELMVGLVTCQIAGWIFVVWGLLGIIQDFSGIVRSLASSHRWEGSLLDRLTFLSSDLHPAHGVEVHGSLAFDSWFRSLPPKSHTNLTTCKDWRVGSLHPEAKVNFEEPLTGSSDRANG